MPSPTVVSFTSGAGPEGYTTLNATMFGTARARADAANVLPYLAGRGGLVARAFPDRTVAWARVGSVQLAVVLGVALVLGVIAGLCVPRLPRGVPRRDMSMWGWVAVLTADGLLDETHGRGAGVVDRHSEVEEVEKVFGGEKVRYTSLM